MKVGKLATLALLVLSVGISIPLHAQTAQTTSNPALLPQRDGSHDSTSSSATGRLT
jgi:hypothetical protein